MRGEPRCARPAPSPRPSAAAPPGSRRVWNHDRTRPRPRRRSPEQCIRKARRTGRPTSQCCLDLKNEGTPARQTRVDIASNAAWQRASCSGVPTQIRTRRPSLRSRTAMITRMRFSPSNAPSSWMTRRGTPASVRLASWRLPPTAFLKLDTTSSTHCSVLHVPSTGPSAMPMMAPLHITAHPSGEVSGETTHPRNPSGTLPSGVARAAGEWRRTNSTAAARTTEQAEGDLITPPSAGWLPDSGSPRRAAGRRGSCEASRL